jgi:hypothetical protein
MTSRWPSNTEVVQPRSFTVSEAQIFAAAAASLMGPATRRNCMPSPLLFSLITMIGRSVDSAALLFDLRSPRHNARNPGTEFAPPTSTPNSVRRATSSTAGGGGAGSGSACSEALALTIVISGNGADVTVFGGPTGAISFPAAGSGGAIIDFEAIREPDGCAGADATCCAGADATAVELGSDDVGGLEACLSCFSRTAGAVAATGATTGTGADLAAADGASAEVVAAGAVAVPAAAAIDAVGGGTEVDADDAAEAEGLAEGAALALA